MKKKTEASRCSDYSKNIAKNDKQTTNKEYRTQNQPPKESYYRTESSKDQNHVQE